MNGSIFRILDANANRAREALRVLEDYARFALDDQTLCGELKSLRHELVELLKPILATAVLWRDTPNDVGTEVRIEAEQVREGTSDVIIAAGKRLGEALRTLEEYVKTLNPPTACGIERLRYRFYEIEQRLAFTLRPVSRMFDVRLYVLITESICKIPWIEAAEQAILGGADCLQLREKTLESGELLVRARQFVALCHRQGVISIINDRPDIALLAGADGVHVGQSDLPPREVRKLIGLEKILGVSTHNLAQARQAVLDGADYIGVGPFFKSETKTRDFIAGPAYARQIAETIRIPAVAIAGITLENVDEVLATGIKAVAVTACVVGNPNPRAAAEKLKAKLVQ